MDCYRLTLQLKHIVTRLTFESLEILPCFMCVPRGELSYLAPLGSENISAPYFKQCFCSRRDMIAVECLSTPQLSYRDADVYT